MISLTIPGLRLVSEANAHEHWRHRAKRAEAQRAATLLLARTALARGRPQLPLVVTITRLGPGKLDSDNLTGSAKHVRDGVAQALGIDDGDDRVTWVVGWRKAKGYGVEVTIAARTCCPTCGAPRAA